MGKPFPDFDGDFEDGLQAEHDFKKALGDLHYEHKHDRKATDTGNVFIEFQTDIASGVKPSGISTTKARFWVTEYDDDCWIVLRTSCVKALARKAWLEKRRGKGGDNGRFSGALVPVSWLLNPWRVLDGRWKDAA